MICKNFLLFWRLPVHIVNSVFAMQSFAFDVVPFVNFCFWCFCFRCYVKKNPHQEQHWWDSSLYFLPGVIWYLVLRLCFWSILSEFLWVILGVQFHCSAYVSPVFLIPFVQDPILSPLGILGSLVEQYVTIQARIKFWALYSVPWVSLATLVSVHLILFYY